MSETSQTQYYFVRTIPELVEQDLVGVGWVDFQFDKIPNAEEAIRQINGSYGIGRYGNQVRRFFSMRQGDIVISPLPYAVAIGYSTGGMFFNPAYFDADRANHRRVKFHRDAEGKVIKIPRDSFSEAFQRRLRVMGMIVNDFGEFQDEINRVLSAIGKGETYRWGQQLDEEVDRQQIAFKSKLIDNIQSGKTNLQAGGVGLENLVCELLAHDGYHATVLSKRQFGSYADADIEASRSDRFSVTRLLVQVKHHRGWSDAHGLDQLSEIRTAHPDTYDDHLLVLVTSASVPLPLKTRAQNEGIIVVDGVELSSWICEHIERLSKKTKSVLGIYEVPAVL